MGKTISGIVNTPMLSAALERKAAKPQDAFTPIARNAEPIEIAYTLSFLLGDESKFTTGAIYGIDGGWNV
jgi:NAD(P)-dependent dehydrogenase (short-subunit alcohol dehydrogenase family)